MYLENRYMVSKEKITLGKIPGLNVTFFSLFTSSAKRRETTFIEFFTMIIAKIGFQNFLL